MFCWCLFSVDGSRKVRRHLSHVRPSFGASARRPSGGASVWRPSGSASIRRGVVYPPGNIILIRCDILSRRPSPAWPGNVICTTDCCDTPRASPTTQLGAKCYTTWSQTGCEVGVWGLKVRKYTSIGFRCPGRSCQYVRYSSNLSSLQDLLQVVEPFCVAATRGDPPRKPAEPTRPTPLEEGEGQRGGRPTTQLGAKCYTTWSQTGCEVGVWGSEL